MKALCAGLGKCKNLIYIDLSGNALSRFNYDPLHYLSSRLALCKTLQYLNLSENDLSEFHLFNLFQTVIGRSKSLLQIKTDPSLPTERKAQLEAICIRNHGSFVTRLNFVSNLLMTLNENEAAPENPAENNNNTQEWRLNKTELSPYYLPTPVRHLIYSFAYPKNVMDTVMKIDEAAKDKLGYLF